MPTLRLSELASLVGGDWEGPVDPVISGAGGIETAGPGQITFLSQKRFMDLLAQSRASAVILKPGVECALPVLRADEPYATFALVLAHFAMPRSQVFPPGIHPTAVVDTSADLGEGVSLGPCAVVAAGARIGARTALGAHVVIGPEVVIGEDCTLYPQVTIREGCQLGNGVVVHAGAVIGADGFGYLPDRTGLRKIPQIGTVILEDLVEIGANTCIDRATTGCTVIGAGTKLDNLVQVAHNVTMGKHCAMSAQTGIAGSCQIGDRVTMGGNVGLNDHVRIGDDVKVGAKSGIRRDVAAGVSMFGYPALEAQKAFRVGALVQRLPELMERLRKLERALATSRERDEDQA